MSNPCLASAPAVQAFAALTYVAARIEVTMDSLGERVGAALEELERYLASRGINPSGPSVIRYRVVAEDAPFMIEVGWVTAEGIWIDAPYVADVLPEGVYAVATHVGPYGQISASTRDLLQWADAAGGRFAVGSAPDGHEWGCWYELYVTEPVAGPEGPTGTVEIRMLTAR